jgi:hydroxymethylpyrimidine pyrophosphatase-like HAD family hydrolase
VRFAALACDYDGTLADRDRIGPEALAALERARQEGLRLILVTGRTFFDLARVCERLDLFDGVVAENGAVLYSPRAGALRDQAPPPPSHLLGELDRRGIPYQLGRVVVATARSNEPGVLEALSATGVGLAPVHNRGALMLLPQGVSKGTGVREELRELGLSPHDVLALGDAENDLELFDACGFAACPHNAVPILRDRADWVFPGENGRAIAAAIVGPILSGDLRVGASPRHRLEVGWASGTAEQVTIPSRDINLLVSGDPGAGKSWLAGALVERLNDSSYAACVIDPEGDYRSLAELPGIDWIEIRDRESVAQAVARFERDPSACAIMDFSALTHTQKVRLIEATLDLVRRLRRRLGRPHWVILDEAHYSLHPSGVHESAVGLDRKGFCLVTYKPSWLRPAVLSTVDMLACARTTAPQGLSALHNLLASAGEAARHAVAALPDLPPGRFLLVRPGSAAGPVTFAASPRHTSHVRHRRKYADSRVAAQQRFFFRDPHGHLVATADSLGACRKVVATLPACVLANHAGRGDLSRWVLDVFGDRALGRQIRKLEGRWSRGEIPDLRPKLRELIALRYGTDT